jgi:anti-sigma-K factor RskA
MATSEWHRPYAEELAAYLLDGLTPEEASAFELHLAGCAGCQAEERWLRTAVDVLPSSLEQFEPSLELRQRLMATVRADAKAERDGRRPARRNVWSFIARPATAVAAAVVLAAGVGGYLIRGGGEGGVTTKTFAAKPIGAVPTASGEVVKTAGTTVLRVEGLPLQRRGRVYQVWLASGKQIIPSSLFVVDRGGHGSVAIPGGLERVQAVMVSNEPAGGSKAPTTKPVLQASIQ